MKKAADAPTTSDRINCEQEREGAAGASLEHGPAFFSFLLTSRPATSYVFSGFPLVVFPSFSFEQLTDV